MTPSHKEKALKVEFLDPVGGSLQGRYSPTSSHIEGGHILVLGTHYSAKMKCHFLDEDTL